VLLLFTLKASQQVKKVTSKDGFRLCKKQTFMQQAISLTKAATQCEIPPPATTVHKPKGYFMVLSGSSSLI